MTTSREKVSLATGIGMDMHFIAMMVLLAYKLKIRAHMIEHRNLRYQWMFSAKISVFASLGLGPIFISQ